MVVGLNIYPFIVVDLVYTLDEGVVGSDIGFLFDCLGNGVSCLSCLGVSLEDLFVVQFLLYNF